MSDTSNEQKKGEWLPYLKNPVVISIVITMLLLPFLKPLLTNIPQPPPVIADLPEFSLTDQNGNEFKKSNLIGNVHIVGFIFTRCQGICPFTIEAMKKLSHEYDSIKLPIKLIAISVDPDFDKPDVLLSYAKNKNLDLSRWHLLTGNRDPLIELIEGGFKLAAGSKIEDEKNLKDISHTSKLALVDGNGSLRGYFDTTKDGIDEIFHRSQHVLFSMSQKKISIK